MPRSRKIPGVNLGTRIVRGLPWEVRLVNLVLRLSSPQVKGIDLDWLYLNRNELERLLSPFSPTGEIDVEYWPDMYHGVFIRPRVPRYKKRKLKIPLWSIRVFQNGTLLVFSGGDPESIFDRATMRLLEFLYESGVLWLVPSGTDIIVRT